MGSAQRRQWEDKRDWHKPTETEIMEHLSGLFIHNTGSGVLRLWLGVNLCRLIISADQWQ